VTAAETSSSGDAATHFLARIAQHKRTEVDGRLAVRSLADVRAVELVLLK